MAVLEWNFVLVWFMSVPLFWGNLNFKYQGEDIKANLKLSMKYKGWNWMILFAWHNNFTVLFA